MVIYILAECETMGCPKYLEVYESYSRAQRRLVKGVCLLRKIITLQTNSWQVSRASEFYREELTSRNVDK